MKRTMFILLAFAVCLFMTAPAWAQKGGQGAGKGQSAAAHGKAGAHKKTTTRSNKGGATRGVDRARQVQLENTKADTERGFTTAPGLDQAGTASNGKKPAEPGKSQVKTGKKQ